MLYRFRSVERLLENKELEDNYFYFSSPPQQNDPLEGYVDFYWKGDKIAWLGLFKHYVWQLFMVMYNSLLTHDIEKLKELSLWTSAIFFKGLPLLDIRDEIHKEFLEDVFIQKLAVELEKCEIGLSGIQLQYILSMIHKRALNIANEKVYEKFNAKIIEWELDDEQQRKMEEKAVLSYLQNINKNPDATIVAEFIDSAFASWNLIMQSDFKNAPDYEGKKIYLLLLSEFSQVYVRRIPWLAFPEWYCVCFSDNITNPALWGYYADSHKGVCLKFKNDIDGIFELRAVNKPDGRIKYEYKMKINKVKYEIPPVHVEFFSCLGRIFGDERGHWLINEGEYSEILRQMFADEKKWHEEYIKNNEERFLRKSLAWENEREYRIVLDDSWYSHAEDCYRKFEYDFNDLEGIVFGINTPNEQKLEIIDIIKKKCIKEKREKFMFYQAEYDAGKNMIIDRPIIFLNSRFEKLMQEVLSGKEIEEDIALNLVLRPDKHKAATD